MREDIGRYFFYDRKINFFKLLKRIILTQGIWALIIFRAGSWCHRNKNKHLSLKLFLPILTIFQKIIEILTGIQIPFTAEIGKGLYIGHFGGIILSDRASLGEYCNISQGVTIGQGGRDGKQYVPVIGNRVHIAPGAKVFGKITIGDNVSIGANAVVTKDVPHNAVVVGIPARIISYDGSSDFIIVKDKSSDVN